MRLNAQLVHPHLEVVQRRDVADFVRGHAEDRQHADGGDDAQHHELGGGEGHDPKIGPRTHAGSSPGRITAPGPPFPDCPAVQGSTTDQSSMPHSYLSHRVRHVALPGEGRLRAVPRVLAIVALALVGAARRPGARSAGDDHRHPPRRRRAHRGRSIRRGQSGQARRVVRHSPATHRHRLFAARACSSACRRSMPTATNPSTRPA
jgi:hypothetical protein